MEADQQGSTSAITAQFVMPWFMGAAFIPKFDGDITKFGQWRVQVEAMLRAQGLSPQQQADFLLGALEGNAKRELQLVSPTEKDTGQKVLRNLHSLYAQPVTKAHLRTHFFNCKQRTDEAVVDFILRLRELFFRWQECDPEGTDDGDQLLLDQLMIGLNKGPVRQELSRQWRRQDRMTFKEACKEAQALAREYQEDEEVAQSNRIVTSQVNINSERLKSQIKAELKDELLGEIKTEIKEQLKVLSADLVAEIRTQFTAHNQQALPVPAYQRRPQSRAGRPQNRAASTPYQWDPEGRPICLACGMAGHVQRRCPQRTTRPQDF